MKVKAWPWGAPNCTWPNLVVVSELECTIATLQAENARLCAALSGDATAAMCAAGEEMLHERGGRYACASAVWYAMCVAAKAHNEKQETPTVSGLDMRLAAAEAVCDLAATYAWARDPSLCASIDAWRKLRNAEDRPSPARRCESCNHALADVSEYNTVVCHQGATLITRSRFEVCDQWEAKG